MPTPGESPANAKTRSMTVRSRLRGLLLALMALGVVSATLVTLASIRQDKAQDVLVNRLVPARRALEDLSSLVAAASGLEESATDAEEPLEEGIARLREQISRDLRHEEDLLPTVSALEDDLDEWMLVHETGTEDADGTQEWSDALERIDALGAAVDLRVNEATEAAAHASALVIAASIGTGLVLLVAGIGGLVAVSLWIIEPIDALIADVGAVGRGDLGHPIAIVGPPDIASIAEAAETMRQRLLEETDRRVESALIAGQLAESDRIAGELHDDQIQAMTLASIRLQQVRRGVEGDDDLTAIVDNAEKATRSAIDRLRRMIFELKSPVLDRGGLSDAIEVYLEETFGLVDDVPGAGQGVAWTVVGDAGGLDTATAAIAYRLAREAMFNVFKHAAAEHLEVQIDRTPAELVVEITDDGRGFEPEQVESRAGHLGLAHAHDLAVGAGGSWHVTSSPGRGTTVRFVLPASPAAELTG